MCACRLDWYGKEHDFEERNNLYIQHAVDFGVQAVLSCLQGEGMLDVPIEPSMIDAIYFISSSGISTPSIEARIMNRTSFSGCTKRVPIWGLGCAGGAAGY